MRAIARAKLIIFNQFKNNGAIKQKKRTLEKNVDKKKIEKKVLEKYLFEI